jgi:hypothetical protein
MTTFSSLQLYCTKADSFFFALFVAPELVPSASLIVSSTSV